MGHWTEIGLNDSLRALQGACLLLAGLLPLHAQQRTYQKDDNIQVPTVDIAAKAKGYTVLIECWK